MASSLSHSYLFFVVQHKMRQSPLLYLLASLPSTLAGVTPQLPRVLRGGFHYIPFLRRPRPECPCCPGGWKARTALLPRPSADPRYFSLRNRSRTRYSTHPTCPATENKGVMVGGLHRRMGGGGGVTPADFSGAAPKEGTQTQKANAAMSYLCTA